MPRLSKIGAACLAAFGYSSGSLFAANFLVIGGGGGGGGGAGGGGGSGGYRTSTGTSGGNTSAESPLNLNPLLSYTVIVGAGGAGGAPYLQGVSGTNSVFSSITSIGGGFGGGHSQAIPAGTGGSGGGAGGGLNSNNTAGSGTANQGFNGGIANNSPSAYGAGGGGGASAVGNNGSAGSATGSGGNGLSNSITGTAVTRAGGGGGGTNLNVGAAGGSGGGGASGNIATKGTVNTGSGGGAGVFTGSTYTAGAGGGSGVVIISYTSPTQLFGGGTVTFVGGNWIHTFTTSGTLVPASTFTASTVIVGGGGGSGYSVGGGAGAGGLLSSTFTLDANSNYIVTVGSGGSGSTTNPSNGTAGTGSSFLTITTAGGGRGANYGENTAGAGGSGAGAAGAPNTLYTAGSGNTPATTPAQGNNGGANAVSGAVGQRNSGGGGGAGAVGQTGTTTKPGNGGAGSINPIAGSTTGQNVGGIYYLAGGGGGGSDTGNTNQGLGGNGGGGAGGIPASINGVAGTVNTGGGGGGGYSVGGVGANGGSGVVIISYAGAQRMAGGNVTFVGGNTIHTFTSSGYLSALKLVDRSLRFKASTTSYLTRTPTVAGNQQIFTFSSWVKRGALSVDHSIWGARQLSTSNPYFWLAFNASTDILSLNTNNGSLLTTQVFRDPAAWYHIVVSIDTTQATAANRMKLYVNGLQITSFSTATYPTQNTNMGVNSTIAHWIGIITNGIGGFSSAFDGYQTEINFIDGQALTPSSFGGYNSFGVWQPTQYLGSYGTNGFYLPFTDNTSATTIGYDFSPNQNNWTANGFTLTPTTSVNYDSMTDVPTLTSETAANYAVLNSLANGGTLSNANLTTTGGDRWSISSIGMTSGKFYAEVTITTVGTESSVGIANRAWATGEQPLVGNLNTGSWGYWNSGNKANNTNAAYGASYTTGDVIGIAFDADIGTLTFYKNGVSQGAAFTGLLSSTYFFAVEGRTSGTANNCSINFGQKPFTQTVPTGFVALNTFNM
jgi:hypothetical protein